MTSQRLLLIFIVIMTLMSSLEMYARGDNDAERDDVLRRREGRRRELEGVLEHLKEQISHHHSGRRELEDRRLQSLQRRVEVYQEQISEHSRPLTEEEIQKLIEQSREDKSEL